MTPPAADMTRDEADALIAEWTIPDEVAGTRNDPSEPWRRGPARDLRNSQWLIRTGSLQQDVADIDFDTVVGVGAARLRPHEMATKKVMGLCWLAGMTGRGKCRATGLVRNVNALDWLFRYERSLGVTRNHDLTPGHLNDFRDRLKGPVVRLVPISDRIRERSDHLAQLHPDSQGAKGAGKPSRMPRGVTAMAADLGVTVEAIKKCPAAVAELWDAVGGDALPSARRLRASGKPRKASERNARSVQGYLDVWEDLHRLDRLGILSDGLSFAPFEGTTSAVVSKVDGVQGEGREAVAPENLYKWLFAASVVVTVWGGAVKRAVDRYHRYGGRFGGRKGRHRHSGSLDAELPEGMPRLSLGWRWQLDEDPDHRAGRMNLTEAVQALFTAVAVLVMTFAACSSEEARGVSEGSLSEPRPGCFELVVRTDDLLGPLRKVPVPPVLATGLRLARDLTATTRAVTGDGQLFRILWTLREGNGDEPTKFCSLPRQDYLAAFAAMHGLPPLAPGTDRTTADQFRAGFGMALLYAVPGGNWESLRQFLGYRFMHQLRIYIRGGLQGRIAALRGRIEALRLKDAAEHGPARLAELRALLAELERQAAAVEGHQVAEFTKLALRIASGSERAGGRGGDRLEADVAGQVARLQADLEHGFRNDVDWTAPASARAMRALHKSHGFAALPEGQAFCAFRSGHAGDAAAAVCLRLKAARQARGEASPPDLAPDMAYSGLSPCLGKTPCSDPPLEGRGGCVLAITTTATRAVVDGQGRERVRMAEEARGPVAKEQAKAVVDAVLEAIRNARPKGGA